MTDADVSAQHDVHIPMVRKFFEQAIKFTRSGVFQLKKAANAVGMHIDEKTVTLSGWLDFCHANNVRRRFMIVEADLVDIFNMCRMGQTATTDTLSMDQFQKCLIMLGSKIGLRAKMPPHTAQLTSLAHGLAFDSLIGVVALLHEEFSHPPDPWKPLLAIVPKMKTLFQKVAKNSKDPIGSLGKSGSLVSCREFIRFYDEQNVNLMFETNTSNSKLMTIFKKSQITPNSEKSQCDMKEFSYAIMLLAIELGVLSSRNLEFYVDTAEGVHSIFDQCDPSTGEILNNFVQQLLGLQSQAENTDAALRKNAGGKQRRKGVSLMGGSKVQSDEPHEESSVSFEPLQSTKYDDPNDGSLNSRKIREIVAKGYIYRRSKTASYIADSQDVRSGLNIVTTAKNVNIEDAEFNPILDLLEDECIELAVEVEEHQKKEIIQCLRRNAFRRHLTLQIEGHDQSTSANSVASILEFVIQRAFEVCDNIKVRENLSTTLDRRWNIGQRCTICKVGINHLSLAIIYELVDEAVDFSIETERKREELHLTQIRESGLIWNRTSPGWRYFRAMHVYEELYTQRTVPEIEAVNSLHKATKDYYSDHIEKVVQSHKSQSRSAHSPAPGSPNSTITAFTDFGNTATDQELVQSEPESGLTVSWKLRQRIRQDCSLPMRFDTVAVEIGESEFDLQLSPHLSNALKDSGKQQKHQNFLSAIKKQAKSINEAVIANYSVPSPTFLKRQRNRELQDVNDKAANEAKESAQRQALRNKQAVDQLKSSKAEAAMKFLEEQSKIDNMIQEGKKVADFSKQLMEQKREEITEERIAVIRSVFDADTKAGKQVVCGFSGKMQRLPSTMDQFEAKMALYMSPVSSPSKQLSSSSPLGTRPSTPNSSQSFMHPKLWASVVSAHSSPENSRPSTSHSAKSPTAMTMPPMQGFTASITKAKARSPSLERVSLFPGINTAAVGGYLK